LTNLKLQWKRAYRPTKDTYYGDLDGNPPLEIRASITRVIKGLIAKLDHGNVIVFGQADAAVLTEWADLEGPVIGFHF
jgi:hypothetical protein